MGVSHRSLLASSLAFLLIAGCGEKLPDGLHRTGSSGFTMAEAKAVAVAKADLEKSGHKGLDARYRVRPAPEGYRVHVAYVAGYQHGQPLFIPGGFCEVLVSTQWVVIKILPGA
jgi:hypothetical protein